MKITEFWQRPSVYGRAVRLLAVSLFLGVMPSAHSASPSSKGWELEREVEEPRYASIEPTKSNLNIDALVLTCVVTQATSVLQLQLYLSIDGSLMPDGIELGQLRPDPRVLLSIDGQIFPMTMFFADDHLLVADAVTQNVLSLSEPLVDAIQNGRNMTIEFDFVPETPRQSGVEGEAEFDLQANKGGGAVASVRRYCLVPDTHRLPVTGHLHHYASN